MSNERIISKIKKLLALSKSSNANEAAIALNQAQKLMKEHNIDLVNIEVKEEVNGRQFAYSGGSYVPFIASIIKDTFGVEVLVQGNAKRKVSYVFVGTKDKAEVASYFFDVLIRKIMQARRNKLKELSESLKYANKKTKIKIADSFCLGWCCAVSQKLEKMILEPAEEEMLKNYLNQKTFSQNNYFEKMKEKSNNIVISATQEGYQEGKNVELFFGMKGQAKKQEMIGVRYE